MKTTARKYLRLIPATYFMLLGIFAIVMELLNNGLTLHSFYIYAFLFLPILVPVKVVWITFGLILSFIFAVFLLNGFSWLIQYLNGAYFKYPFDTFVVGFPFIVWSLLCAMAICYAGLTSADNALLRIKQ